MDYSFDPNNSYRKKVQCLGYTSLTSASGTPNGVMLKFTLPKEGNVVIYRSTAENSGFTRIGTAQKTTYLDISAKSGVLYYYKVRYEYDNHLSGSGAAKKAASACA